MEANQRLERRGITKKKLARAFKARGIRVSETMIVRCLLADPQKRIPTIEAIGAISDALGIPRPVIIAESIEQARELEAAVAFSEADAKMLALAAEASDQGTNGEQETAVQERNTATMDGGRSRATAARSKSVRRPPRAG